MSLLMTGCGQSFEELNRTEAGHLLEEVFPQDTWFWLAFNTLDDDQRENFQHFMGKLSEDPDAFRSEFLRGVDDNLGSVDLSYIEDIQPILGDEGLRFALGFSVADGSEDQNVAHAALTLADVPKAQDLFVTLESEGRFVKITEGDYDVYYNVYAEQSGDVVYYFSLFDDLLLISNEKESLVEMLNLAKSEGDDSLWTSESYQAVLEELPQKNVAMLFMDGEFLGARQEETASTISKVLLKYLEGEGMAFVAEEDGLEFRGVALGDVERIDEDDASLDALQARKSYLSKDMPGEKLAVYVESYNFASILQRQLGEGGEGFLYTTLGLDPSYELEDFLGEGYSIGLHRNEGFLPGLTLLVDVSDNSVIAETMIESIDIQLGTFIGLFQFQGGEVASALSKHDVEIQGGDFHVVSLDVDAIMDLYQTDGIFNLPDEIRGQSIHILYGVTDDERLVFSTYDGWLDDPSKMLVDMNVYEETVDRLADFKEGIVYVSFDEVLLFIDEFQSFRDALSADAALIHEENADLLGIQTDLEELEMLIDEVEGDIAEAEGDAIPEDGTEGVVEEVVIEEEVSLLVDEVVAPVNWSELLGNLKSLSFSSDANKYDVRMGGVILLED
jgi:hypothetical protein